MSNPKRIETRVNRMFLNSLLSSQPIDTYRKAQNAVKTREGALMTEGSTELFVNIPGIVRGVIQIEERDYFIVFVSNDGGGEIGILKPKTKTYSKITNVDIAKDLGICEEEFIDCEAKIMQPCNHLYLYWSSKDVYKRINIDDPCCKFEEIPLIKPVSVGNIEVVAIERGGNLPNGIYQFAARARDLEGNYSNYSEITNPVSVADGDFKPGERSKQALSITINNVDNRDYHILELVVLSTINRVTSVKQIATISTGSGENAVNYVYQGDTGEELDLQLSNIISRKNRYIRGKNLIQYNNRLILYNLKPIHNLDYQHKANQIKAEYGVYLIPIEEVEKYKSLLRNEAYQPSIRWKYTDGTFSPFFIIPNEDGEYDPCKVYEDNSQRLRTLITFPESVFDKTIDLDPRTDYDVDPLFDDEGTAVEIRPEDAPTITDEIDKELQELEHLDFELKSNLDCLCAYARALADKYEPPLGDGGTDIEDDLIGAVALSQLLCMCEEGTETIPDNDPPSKTGTGEGINAPSNPPTFAESGLTNSEISSMIGELETRLGISYSSTSGSGCNDGSCSICGSSCSGSGTSGSCSNSSCAGSIRYVTTEQTVNGRRLERSSMMLKNRMRQHREANNAETIRLSTRSGEKKSVYQGSPCTQEGYTTCVSNICYECKAGNWVVINNADIYKSGPGFEASVGGGYTGEGLGFEKIYDKDGCSVIGLKPKLLATGKFGKRIIAEKYPYTINCNCEYIYGDRAGKNVSLFQVPSVSKEKHVYSFTSGVPNRLDQANSEFKHTYLALIGPKFYNIQFPDNPPKPIDMNEPYQIGYVMRTEQNKSVIGSAIGHSCFKGEISGEFYAIPKHAGNSFERFDRSIEPSGVSSFRGGEALDVGAYIVHSPDFHMRKPALTATHCLIETEMFGKGYRHGCFVEGEKPDHPSQDKINFKGTRQALNLNNCSNYQKPILRSVKAMSYAPADSIVNKGNGFSYPLCNLHRESSTYVELEGGIESFKRADVGPYGGKNSIGDGASDRSFTGDIFTDHIPIHDARAHLMTFIKFLPNQYGSLISQEHVPLGLNANGWSSEISGLVGDSFVGPITYKRPGYVSDKTNRVISRFVQSGGFTNASDNIIKRVLGNLMASLFRVLGIKNGGYVPKNQDPSDFIRVFGGLRFIHPTVQSTFSNVNNPGEVSEGKVPPPFPQSGFKTRTSNFIDVNHGDNYVPGTLVTGITSYLCSDVNTGYRQLGSKDAGELYYSSSASTLKGLKIDSSLPEETPVKKAWLTRWGSWWKENAKWKLIVQGVLTFVFTYIIGMWIMWKGFEYVVNGAQAVGGGMYGLQTIGAILAMTFGVVLIILGIAWIKFWVSQDSDNKLIEEMVGLKNIRPDKRNADKSYSFDESRFLDFEDNHWAYDSTHSMPNRLEIGYTMSDPYITCVCPDEYYNKILYSNEQVLGSPIDAWRNFQPNDFIDVPTDRGAVKKVFVLGNSVYVHTTDMLMHVNSGGRTFPVTDESVYLGAGNLFSSVSPIYGGVVEGYAGLLDPNAAHVFKGGYFFVDRKSREPYLFTGSTPRSLTNGDIQNFMDVNLDIELLNHFPDFKLVDLKLPHGVGYSFGVDYINDRLLLTKTDYKPIKKGIKLNSSKTGFVYDGKPVSVFDKEYFDDLSFTISYCFRQDLEGWVSFHSYKPAIYLWDRYNMMSIAEKALWMHNSKDNFLNFYGKYYDFMVQYVINSDEAFTLKDKMLFTEAYEVNGKNEKLVDKTFDKMVLYNNYQSTGVLKIVDEKDMDLVRRSSPIKGEIKTTYHNRAWNLNNFSDRVIDTKELINKTYEDAVFETVNEENIGDIKNNQFDDNVAVNTLIFNTFGNIKLILKKIITRIDYKA